MLQAGEGREALCCTPARRWLMGQVLFSLSPVAHPCLWPATLCRAAETQTHRHYTHVYVTAPPRCPADCPEAAYCRRCRGIAVESGPEEGHIRERGPKAWQRIRGGGAGCNARSLEQRSTKLQPNEPPVCKQRCLLSKHTCPSPGQPF